MPETESDTARSSCAAVLSAAVSLHTSPPGGTTTRRLPSNVTALGRPRVAASLPSLWATVAASTVSGVRPKVFWTRIRTASPPWLRWVIMRSDWSRSGVGARPCCEAAQDVNQASRPG